MGKLIQYELNKNRRTLLFMIGAIGLLELFYLFILFTGNEPGIELCGALLIFLFWGCLITLFLLTVIRYFRILSLKEHCPVSSSPVSGFALILSRMLTTLLEGMGIAAFAAALLAVDVVLYSLYHPQEGSLFALIKSTLQNIRVPLPTFFLSLVSLGLTALVTFFSLICAAFLSITLSGLLTKTRRPNAMASVILFLLLILLIIGLSTLLPMDFTGVETMPQAAFALLPVSFFNLLTFTACFFLTGWLLENRLSRQR